MKNFMILFTVIAFVVLASCSRLDDDRWYDKPGDDYPDADNEAQNDAEPTDTGDTDSANTGDSGNTDSADSADTSDVTDSGEPVDTAPDDADTAPDSGDTEPDEGDTTPDEGDTTPDEGDTTPDEGDTTPDEGDTKPDDDGDSEPDTGDNEPDDDGDSEPDTGDNEPDDDIDEPDTGDNEPDDDIDEPDTGDNEPDDDIDEPDTGDNEPDDDIDEPDTGDNEPDDDIDEPDTGDNEPDDDIDEPDTGDNEPDDDIDEPDTGETPEECTQITLTKNINIEGDGGIDHPDNSVFYTSYTPNTGSSEADTFYVKFIGLTSFEGEFKLEGKNMSNKEGLLIYVKEDGGATIYFQRSGTVNVEDNYDDGWLGLNGSATISATLTDVVLEQVTIDESSNESSPVNGGACLKVSNTTLKYDEKIEGWL